MIQAVIFDMDGVLIDSEPLWRIAEIEGMRSVGVQLTDEMAHTTTGLRTDEVVEHWFSRYPWTGTAHQEVEARIVNRVMQLVNEGGVPMPGVLDVIAGLTERGYPLAVASSSSSELIHAVVAKFGISGSFRALQSAEHEPYGKPHPGVYLAAAVALGVRPAACLAFEDSVNGTIAAKAAKMRCIAIPDAISLQDRRFGIADRVLPSLKHFDFTMLDEL
jgi:sugar-phosphatase